MSWENITMKFVFFNLDNVKIKAFINSEKETKLKPQA